MGGNLHQSFSFYSFRYKARDQFYLKSNWLVKFIPIIKGKSELGDFFDAMRQHLIKNKDKEGDEGGSLNAEYMWNRFPTEGTRECDLMAPIVLLYPELITNQENKPVSVELNGQYTRSMMIVDRNGQVLPSKSKACLVVEIDVEKASQLKEFKFFWLTLS